MEYSIDFEKYENCLPMMYWPLHEVLHFYALSGGHGF